MPPLVKDYLEFRKIEHQPVIETFSLVDCLRTFLPTDGLVDLLNRLLDAIYRKLGEDSSSQEPASILLAGGHGVGKSHLLAVIYSLVGQKGTLAAGLHDPRVQSHIATLRELSPLTIWIDLAEDTDVSLPELVLRRIHTEFEKRFHKQVIDPDAIPGIDTIKAHELITFNIAQERPILVMIDGLSKRAPKRDVQQLNEDIEFLSFMGYSSKTARLFLVVAAHEDFFSPKSPLGIDSTLMAQTLENFRIEWIDRSNLREIITRHVFRKNPRQYQDLKKLYSFLKAKLPNFQYSESEFCDTYPFHPLIFELAEKIKSKLPNFSLLEFVLSTYPKVASHRAISLATIDTLFDRLEYDIKNSPACQRLYPVYQGLAEQAVSRLEDRWKLWGKMLLKATFLFTLADRAPSVRDLTDSLLLYEDSDTGLSYNVVGMLMARMEKAVEHGFSTTDDRLDRTYRLGVVDLREELNKYLLKIADQVPDSDPRLAEILLGAAEKYFADWPIRPGLSRLASPLQTLKVNWKGTERQGLLLHSERVSGRKHHPFEESLEDKTISQKLPGVQEAFQPGETSDVASEPRKAARSPLDEIEWVLWMEPIGLSEEQEGKIKPQKPTDVHWVPSPASTEELDHLKRILALQLTERSSGNDFAIGDLQSLRDEHNLDLANLFRELYLNRGKIITSSQRQAFNQQHLECQTFQTFVNYIFKPNLDQLYPLHPDFGGEQLSDNQVMLITRKLFTGQDPTDDMVQKLAGRFALPLGLVSRSDDVYELNLSFTPPIFLTQVIQYLENLDANERPVDAILTKIRRPPFGLTRFSLHLILTALVADGQIELFDPASNAVITRENLAAIETVAAFPTFKRIQTLRDYPSEVLTQWCRLITGKQALSDISASRGRSAATAALTEWAKQWQELDVSRKLDALPNELLTTQMWRKLAWTKRRFEKVAEIIETTLDNKVSVTQGMAKIIELFGENIGLLEKASRDLVELSHFIQWVENYLNARDYILSAEKTDNVEIERERESLRRFMEAPHELIGSDKRNEFDSVFLSFKEHFIDHYAARHDQSVGPLGNFKLLEELECSKDFRNLQLLASLPLGDPSYVDYMDEWITSFRDYCCSLPARDLLQRDPACKCRFKLSLPLDIAQVAGDLQTFLELGISHHQQMIACYQQVIEHQLNQNGSEDNQQADTIRALFKEGSLPELTQEIVDRLNLFLDTHVIEEKLASPLPILAPTGRITKKQLEVRIQQWLEGLSDKEEVLFTLKDF